MRTGSRGVQTTTISGVTAGFTFEHEASFEPMAAREILRAVPESPGVFALFGHVETDQPYVTRAANLRRRMARLLDAPEELSKRLNLRDRVGRLAWTVTGSEFESLLLLYNASAALFGLAAARHRLKLRTPFFLRITLGHAHPRIYSTNRLSMRALSELYGPFPSRLAADRFADGVLDLFKLRRCWEDLEVAPSHPGCAYGEMRKCMAPCNTSCTAEEYAAESQAVKAFFDTRGESLLAAVAAERERASEAMDFEAAAALHRQWEKVKAAAALADELVRPLPQLRAVVVQTAASPEDSHGEEAAVFLLEHGSIAGPGRLSTLGVRAVREQTGVGSSLFAQPLMLQAVPLPHQPGTATPDTDAPEQRTARLLGELGASNVGALDSERLSDHLALFRRWYYRPEKQRAGEAFLPNPEGDWPLRKILRGAARCALGPPRAMQETDREGAKAIRTKVLHAGRPEVERVVPVFEPPAEATEKSFRSRRSRKVVAGSAAGASAPARPLAAAPES